MFKAAIIPVLVFTASHFQSEVKLDCYKNDVFAGKGTYTEKFEHGRRTSTFHLSGHEKRGIDRTIIQVKTIDSRAFPISEEETVVETGPGGKHELELKVRYDDTYTAILVTVEDRVKTTERTYPPPPGYSLADESDLWFSRLRPVPNTTVRSTVFDIENHGWQRIETTYIGKCWISVGNRRLEVNEVRDVRDGVLREVYLDDKGLPVLMTSGQNRTERHF
jgi:hypothetical protein